MEQSPQPRSTPPQSPPPRPPAHAGGPLGSAAPTIAPGVVACPKCAEPRQEDARYCEECGYDYGTDAPPVPVPHEPSRLSGPVLWLVMLFWAVLAIGGLYFLYTALYAL